MKAKTHYALTEAIEVALARVQRAFDKADLDVPFSDAAREIVDRLLWEEIYERFTFEEYEQ